MTLWLCRITWYTIHHRTVLIIFTLIFQNIITAQMLSVGQDGYIYQPKHPAPDWSYVEDVITWIPIVRSPSEVIFSRATYWSAALAIIKSVRLSFCLSHWVSRLSGSISYRNMVCIIRYIRMFLVSWSQISQSEFMGSP